MIRRGVRALRPTRPAGSVLHLAERPFVGETNSSPTRDGDGLCTLARSGGELSKQHNQRIPARQGTPNTETIVVVTVIGLVGVAVGGANVRRIIVERAATQNTVTDSPPCGIASQQRGCTASDTCWPDWRDRSNSSFAAELPEVKCLPTHSIPACL